MKSPSEVFVLYPHPDGRTFSIVAVGDLSDRLGDEDLVDAVDNTAIDFGEVDWFDVDEATFNACKNGMRFNDYVCQLG